jgi:hypothetical protein
MEFRNPNINNQPKNKYSVPIVIDNYGRPTTDIKPINTQEYGISSIESKQNNFNSYNIINQKIYSSQKSFIKNEIKQRPTIKLNQEIKQNVFNKIKNNVQVKQNQITQPIQTTEIKQNIITTQQPQLKTRTPQRPIYNQYTQTIPTIKTPSFFMRSQSKSPKSTGFYVSVRKQGKWQTIRNKSLEKSDAINYGASVVGTSARASFKIVPSFQPVNFDYKQSYNRMTDFYKKGEVFIERRSKRIKSFGEKKEITFKGIQANRNKKTWVRI